MDAVISRHKPSKPQVLNTYPNAILLKWNKSEIYCAIEKVIYTVQIQDCMDGWKNIYWGYKTQCVASNLFPTMCYSFRLCLTIDGVNTQWSQTLVAGTDQTSYDLSRLNSAIKYNQFRNVKQIVQFKPQLLDVEDRFGKTPFTHSLELDNFQMLNFFVNSGVDINKNNLLTNQTYLMTSVFKGKLNVADLLIKKGALINLQNQNGMTALHFAVDSNTVENVKYVLNNGADVNIADSNGWTPLLRSVILRTDEAIIRLLLDKNSDPKVRDKWGLNCYDHAVLSNSHSLNILFKPVPPDPAVVSSQV